VLREVHRPHPALAEALLYAVAIGDEGADQGVVFWFAHPRAFDRTLEVTTYATGPTIP
jgi:hypothetical protein